MSAFKTHARVLFALRNLFQEKAGADDIYAAVAREIWPDASAEMHTKLREAVKEDCYALAYGGLPL